MKILDVDDGEASIKGKKHSIFAVSDIEKVLHMMSLLKYIHYGGFMIESFLF